MAFEKPPEDYELLNLPALEGQRWADPKTGDPLAWRDSNGVGWELCVARDSGELGYARQRHYFDPPTVCTRGQGHTVRPTRWPIQPQRTRMNGAVVEVDGYMIIRCDTCGSTIALEAWHAGPDGQALPPASRIN